MDYPISADEKGVRIAPEHMEKEKLYYCVFQEKILLFFKDSQEFLNCYEIEEEELISEVKGCKTKDGVEKILEDYILRENLKH